MCSRIGTAMSRNTLHGLHDLADVIVHVRALAARAALSKTLQNFALAQALLVVVEERLMDGPQSSHLSQNTQRSSGEPSAPFGNANGAVLAVACAANTPGSTPATFMHTISTAEEVSCSAPGTLSACATFSKRRGCSYTPPANEAVAKDAARSGAAATLAAPPCDGTRGKKRSSDRSGVGVGGGAGRERCALARHVTTPRRARQALLCQTPYRLRPSTC